MTDPSSLRPPIFTEYDLTQCTAIKGNGERCTELASTRFGTPLCIRYHRRPAKQAEPEPPERPPLVSDREPTRATSHLPRTTGKVQPRTPLDPYTDS